MYKHIHTCNTVHSNHAETNNTGRETKHNYCMCTEQPSIRRTAVGTGASSARRGYALDHGFAGLIGLANAVAHGGSAGANQQVLPTNEHKIELLEQ